MVRGKRKATKNDLVSYEVIQMASMGDALAMEQVLKHYDGFIKHLATKHYNDGNGRIHNCVDAALYSRLRTKLIQTVMKFQLD